VGRFTSNQDQNALQVLTFKTLATYRPTSAYPIYFSCDHHSSHHLCSSDTACFTTLGPGSFSAVARSVWTPLRQSGTHYPTCWAHWRF